VRRPPRGVRKADYASRNFYDVWLPTLAPSSALVKQALAAESEREWRAFATKYRREMNEPQARSFLDVFAALSHRTNFSLGCYCAEETRCHRGILRELLTEHGAKMSY
jgi:uncharacterized protein YeaO (DUF488 family)